MDLERESLRDYFLPRLVRAWDDRSVGTGHVDDDRYVQWAGYGLGLQIECVSNRLLEGAAKLSPEQMEELRRRGWHDPLGDDLPNHWQIFVDRADVQKAAAALADVVVLLRSPSSAVAHALVARREAQTVLVVPVAKLDTGDVLDTALGALGGMSNPVVVDLFGLVADGRLELPVASASEVLAANEPLARPLLIDSSGLSFADGPKERLLTAAGDLLRLLAQLRTAGKDAVVVGPRLFPPYQWIYAAVLEAAAPDAVIFVLGESPDAWLPRQLLEPVLPALGETPRIAIVPGDAPAESLGQLSDDAVIVRSDTARDRYTLAVLVHALCEGRVPPGSRAEAGRLALPRDEAGKHEDGDDVVGVGSSVGYIEPGTVCHSKAHFADVLRVWFDRLDRGTVIGEPSSFGGKPLVHVWLDGRGFHLNGDSRDAGVEAYLQLVDERGADLAWHVIPNARGRINKVAFGARPTQLRHFYLYADEVSSEPYEV